MRGGGLRPTFVQVRYRMRMAAFHMPLSSADSQVLLHVQRVRTAPDQRTCTAPITHAKVWRGALLRRSKLAVQRRCCVPDARHVHQSGRAADRHVRCMAACSLGLRPARLRRTSTPRTGGRRSSGATSWARCWRAAWLLWADGCPRRWMRRRPGVICCAPAWPTGSLPLRPTRMQVRLHVD